VALVAGNLALIFANRSHRLTVLEMATRENKALAWIFAGASAALLAVIYLPGAAAVFRFAVPGGAEMALAALAGAASVAWYDLYKLVRRRGGEAPREA
jgi:Ca2+-transporting ATPase